MATETDGTVLTVPRFQGRLTRLPRDRRSAFIEHLRRIVWEAMETRVRAGRKRYIGGPTAPQADFAAWACAACGGECCSKGGTHAYLDDETIARVAGQLGVASRRKLTALYESHLPAESFAGSCVFHTSEGCALPRDLRSDMCNRFYCTSLRRFFQAHEKPRNVRIIARGDRHEDHRP